MFGWAKRIRTSRSIKRWLLLLREYSSHLQIVPQRVSNAVSGGKYLQSSLFHRCTRRFGCTVYNTFRDLKSAMEEATEIWTANPQKKPCFRKWEYIKVWPPFILSSCTVGYSECQRSACVTSAKQSAVYLQSAKKNIICSSFSLGKGGKARWFLNLPQTRTNK